MGEIVRKDGQATYTVLRQSVAEVLQAGKERARQAVEAVRVETYSEVGQLIHAHVLAHQDRADYGERVMGRLAEDVGLSEPVLYDALRVYRAFGILNARLDLGWTHYRRLLRLATQKERQAFRRAAIENGWSVRELETAIREGTREGIEGGGDDGEQGGKGAGEKRLLPKRGMLYLYRVKEDKGRLVLDVGFKEGRRVPKEAASELQVGDTVRTIQDEAAIGGYRYERTEVRKQYYAYRATVAKIIDGDTLWATVDFGFDWIAKKKLRLRDIDTPELDTEAGQRAKVHLERVLLAAEPFVITTTQIDLYDRYLTDVFVRPGEQDLEKVLNEGRFLNRELVEQGYARRWLKDKPPEF